MGRLIGARRRLSNDKRGAVAVEFALLFTLMLTMMFGISQFGIALYNKVAMTDASRAAARMLSISRTNATVWTDTRNAFFQAAPGIQSASTTLTISINGTPCTSNATCVTAMATAAGLPATVRAQYPCNLKVLTDFAPGCQLTSITTQRVE